MSALNAPPVVGDLLAMFDHADPTRSHEAKPSERLRQRYAERRTIRILITYAVAMLAFVLAAAHAIPRPAVATDSPSPNGAAAAGNLSPQEQAK